MRVYINHFDLDALPNILTMLNKNKETKPETYIQVYSIDGMYQIGPTTIKKQIVVDNDIEIFNDFHEDFTLIVDKSYFIEEDTTHIEPEHLSTQMKRFVFDVSKTFQIKLIIEAEAVEEKNMFYKNKMSPNFIPNNIYFEMSNNINVCDALVKNDLIGLLSLLN